MSSTTAWHLRNDGVAYNVKVHLYCMQDEDLSSEAEVASFIISTKSRGRDIARKVLDTWMAFLIEDHISYDADENTIERLIEDALNNLPYSFQYPLSNRELLSIHRSLKNYYDIDTYYSFIDDSQDHLKSLQEDIKVALDQQFCRVRYGGQYNTISGNSEIWFRISSHDFNWVNVIYEFLTDKKNSLNIQYVSVCRDTESDEGWDSDSSVTYFKAKDGTVYEHMPIDEYLSEDHDTNPVFESVSIGEGVIHYIKYLLSNGFIPSEIRSKLGESLNYYPSIWNKLKKKEIARDYVAKPTRVCLPNRRKR